MKYELGEKIFAAIVAILIFLTVANYLNGCASYDPADADDFDSGQR